MNTKVDWTTLAPGERVKITLEGEVTESDPNYLDITLNGEQGPRYFSGEVLTHATIERLPREWKVGDRCASGISRGEIVAIADLFAWVLWDRSDGPSTYRLSELTPLPEGDR